jgi:two-component system phosphate regulon response regulator OmpR
MIERTVPLTRRIEPLPDNAPHILVVDDDQRIRDLLARYLSEHGFRVTPAGDTAMARAAMRGLSFDLVILDVMMPGESGLSLARELKQASHIPICMLTARAETEHRIEGLEIGVDDYVAKPFEPRELLLRLQNILKRGNQPSGSREEVRMGDYVFHVGRGELKKGDTTIKLTERERDLMRQFAQRAGMPIARHELATDMTTGSERAIDVQINRLRRKIESDPANPVYLQTVRGRGYILHTD